MQYFLYKHGKLTGPLASEKIEELKQSKKLFEYQWMIDQESQIWKSITEPPKENPFQISNKNIGERSLSAAFFIAKNAFAGEIKQIHSFGIEMLIRNQKSILRGLTESKSIFLNLCDETNFTFVNAKALIQSQEVSREGLHLHFNWDQQEVSL